MAELTKKQERTIDYALNRLFGRKSFFVPKSIKDFGVNNFLTRELRLTGKRTIFLTDAGLIHMRNIVTTIDEADFFDGLAGYSDIWAAFRHILEAHLSEGIRPENAAEFFELMRERLNTEISNYTYAVPLFGVEMDGIDVFKLGQMKIVRSPDSHIKAAGVKYDHADLPSTLEATKWYLWLFGSARGTHLVAQERFREQAELATGMLAISAAAIYKRGVSTFRIGVVMSPREGHNRATWISWNNKSLSLATYYNFGDSQPFKINGDLAGQLSAGSLFTRAFEIFESNSRKQLAIMNGVYWYSDAHRDPVPVMRLIKYWSCVEVFFSADNKDITQSVSTGLAVVLTFGGYNFVPKTEYVSFKKRVAALYNLRSRAVHGAVHHISERKVDDLSRWVAWLLLNMVSFVDRGYTTIKQIKAITDRLDKKLMSESKQK
jgi:hypothetical protein